MTELTVDSLTLDRSRYAAIRNTERARVIRERQLRRVALGPSLSLSFENVETLHYQVQEMVYVEGISDPAAAEAEIGTYSRLLPGPDELVATLLVELEDPASVRATLEGIRGIQHAITLEIDAARIGGVEIPGADETGPSEATYSVHFVRFRLEPGTRDAFLDPGVAAALVSDHPAYQARAPLEGATRAALIADLTAH